MARTILIVDDSASLRGITRLMLEQAGYGVVEAEDGVVALSKLTLNLFDLVVTDLSMPRLDGLTLLKQIKAHKRHAAIPVILLTTESQPLRKEEARRNGAAAWITKPVKPAELLAVVARCLPTSLPPTATAKEAKV